MPRTLEAQWRAEYAHMLQAAADSVPTGARLPWTEAWYTSETLAKLRRRPDHYPAEKVVEWLAEAGREFWWLRQRDGNILIALLVPHKRRVFVAVQPDDADGPQARSVTAYEPDRRKFEAVWRWPQRQSGSAPDQGRR